MLWALSSASGVMTNSGVMPMLCMPWHLERLPVLKCSCRAPATLKFLICVRCLENLFLRVSHVLFVAWHLMFEVSQFDYVCAVVGSSTWWLFSWGLFSVWFVFVL